MPTSSPTVRRAAPGGSLLALALACGDSIAVDSAADVDSDTGSNGHTGNSTGADVPTGIVTDGTTSDDVDPNLLCFDPPLLVDVSLEHPMALHSGDFDGDGSTDLLVLGYDGVFAGRTHYGAPEGFGASGYGFLPEGCTAHGVVLDLGDDGRDEFAFTNCYSGISVHRIEQDGSFTPFTEVLVADPIRQIAHLDLDADGLRDLVLLTGGSDAPDLTVLPGLPGPAFGLAVVSPQPVQFADEPAGLLMRAASGNPAEVVLAQWYASHGFARSQHQDGGSFSAPAWVATDFPIGGLVLADVDADGARDVLAVDADAGQVHALLGPAHALGPVTSLPSDWFSVVPGELDGAGGLDLAVVREMKIDVLAGQGDGAFVLVDTVDFSDFIIDKHLVLTDLDGDGRDDPVAGFFQPYPYAAMVARSCPSP